MRTIAADWWEAVGRDLNAFQRSLSEDNPGADVSLINCLRRGGTRARFPVFATFRIEADRRTYDWKYEVNLTRIRSLFDVEVLLNGLTMSRASFASAPSFCGAAHGLGFLGTTPTAI